MKFNILKNKEKLKINTVKSNTNDNERTREKSTGRSMVEMLGVLAIIGVLSIGGIQGYTLAMRKYRANEIASLVSKYVSVVYMNFYMFMTNNPDDVIINDYWNDYECSNRMNSSSYSTDNDSQIDFSNENCPFYSAYSQEKDFANYGLGALPNGLSHIYTRHILPPSDDIPVDSVDVVLTFNDKELCKSVASLLMVFNASDSGDNGIHCDSNTISKDIPVDPYARGSSYSED